MEMATHPWLSPSAALVTQVTRARAQTVLRALPGIPPQRLAAHAPAWTRLLAALPALLQADAERLLAAVARVDVLPVLEALTKGGVAAERLERALVTLWLGLAGHPGLAAPLALPGPFRRRVVDPNAPRLLALGDVRGLGATARGAVVMGQQGRLPLDGFVVAELAVVGDAVVVTADFEAPPAAVVARVRGAFEQIRSALPGGRLERVTVGDGAAVLGEARVGPDGDAAALVASAQMAFVGAAAAIEPVASSRGVLVENGRRLAADAVLARACGNAVALPWRADGAAAAASVADDLDELAAIAVLTPPGAELVASLRARLGDTSGHRRRVLLVNPDADDFVYSYLFGRSIERRCRERGLHLDRIGVRTGRHLDLAAELGGPVPEPIADGSELLVDSEGDGAIAALLAPLASRRYEAVVANVRPPLLYDLVAGGFFAAPALLWDRHLHGGLAEEGARRGLDVAVLGGPRIRAWSLADRGGEGLHRDLARAGLEHGSGRAWPLDLQFFRATASSAPGRVFAGGNNARDWPLLIAAIRNLPYDVHLVTAEPLPELPAHVRVDRRLTLARFRDAMASAWIMALPLPPGVASGVTVLPMAMALDVAIVATRTIWSEQYITDGETGLLVPAGDADAFRAALVRLHDDPDLRERLVAAARRRVAALCDLDAFTAEMFAALDGTRGEGTAGHASKAAPMIGSAVPRVPASAGLRQLWDGGQRGRAIRAALEQWPALLATAEDLGWLQGALSSCGLEAEACALHLRAARARGTAKEWEGLIRSLLRHGDPWWALELLDDIGSPSRELQSLRIEAELETGDASASIAAWTRDYGDEDAAATAIAWYVRSGRVADAERLLATVSGLAVWRARLALWRRQPEVARTFLAGLPPSSEVACLEAIAAVQEGRLDDAEPLLRPLLDDQAVRGEAGTWLATVLRKRGRYAEAARAAEDASFADPTFNLVARLERELAVDREQLTARAQPAMARLGRWLSRHRPRERAIAQLEHADVLYALGCKPDDPVQSLEAVLERFGGNHTVNLTMIENGALVPVRLPTDPRYLGANVLRVLWTRGAVAARALYRELAPSVHDHPLFRIYAGELELWMGAYADAERIFRDILAVDRKVLWAWIGLGASLMLQGELQPAHDVWDEGLAVMGFAGPTLYVYRGECYRKQGQLDRARAELETAVQKHPQRLSAAINLALLNGDAESLARAERDCTAFAPLLMDELRGSPIERLEGVLEAMRGNRRSSPDHICYHLWGRLWRRALDRGV